MISVTGLGAHILLRNWDSLASRISQGSSLAASTFAGNFMGKGMPLEAKQYSRSSLIFNSLVLSGICFFFGIFKFKIASFLTKEPEIVQTIADLMPVFQIFMFFDSIHIV